MRDYIGEFLTSRRAENSAPNTIRAYAGDLQQVAQFVGSEDWAEKLTRTVVRGFVAWSGRKTAATSVGRKLHALKAFTSWLRTEGILSDDVWHGITSLHQPRKANKLPDVPSQEEMASLLDGPFPSAFPERDRLLLLLMYGDGLRVSETNAAVQPINVRSIHRMLLLMTSLRGLQPMNPHLLRHAAATHMLENDCPLDLIAKVLGHDNIDITAHYAQVTTRLMMKNLQCGASACAAGVAESLSYAPFRADREHIHTPKQSRNKIPASFFGAGAVLPMDTRDVAARAL